MMTSYESVIESGSKIGRSRVNDGLKNDVMDDVSESVARAACANHLEPGWVTLSKMRGSSGL